MAVLIELSPLAWISVFMTTHAVFGKLPVARCGKVGVLLHPTVSETRLRDSVHLVGQRRYPLHPTHFLSWKHVSSMV
jgi:hypothetical protein